VARQAAALHHASFRGRPPSPFNQIQSLRSDLWSLDEASDGARLPFSAREIMLAS
jgi:hypothetical protein